GIEFHVIANHAHAMQIGRSITDKHGPFERRPELAIIDPIGLGHLEHIFAGSDVHLPAAEAHSINPVLYRGDDLAGLAFASEHVGIGHARHGNMSVALTPAISGRPHLHQTRVLAVLHVAHENSVLDQQGAAGGSALIV